MSTMEVKTVCGNCGEVAVKALPVAQPSSNQPGMQSGPQNSGMAQADLPDNAGFVEKRKKGKKRRIHRLTNDQNSTIREVPLADTDSGKKTLEDDDAFLCALDRKVLPGSSATCDNCPGGCCSKSGEPTLIEVEGIAEEELKGEVVDSGYGAKADLFVIQLKREDGKLIEAFYDGKTAECQGWTLLNGDIIDAKSLEGAAKTITADEAKELAVKSIVGEAVAVDPDVFEGDDAWAVEVNGEDGHSYDVFVSLDGNVLGHDDYGLNGDFKSAEGGESTPEGEDVKPGDDEEGDKKPEEDEKKEEKSAESDENFLSDLAEFKSLKLG